MHSRLPVILLSALALAAPGVTYAKDKNKNKGRGAQETPANDRRGGRDGGHDEGDHHDGDDNGGKVTICHVPPGNASARHTITVGESAWAAHQAHGDHRGACGAGGNGGGGGTSHSGFDDLDRNRNGVISLDEWRGDRAGFARLDTNHDGVLSRREYSRL